MNDDEQRKFSAAIAVTGTSFGRPIMEFALEVYVRKMRDVPFQAAMRGLYEAAASGKMPSANELYAAATGVLDDKDESQDTADRIIAAISKFGSYRSADALAAVGEVGEEVIRRFGGWAQICDVTNDQLGTLRAQLRDSARSVLARAKAGRLDEPARLPMPEGPRGLATTGALLAGVLPGR